MGCTRGMCRVLQGLNRVYKASAGRKRVCVGFYRALIGVCRVSQRICRVCIEFYPCGVNSSRKINRPLLEISGLYVSR